MRAIQKTRILGLAIAAVSYLTILLPVALAFLFVYLCGVNVVFWDQWAIVSLFSTLSAGTLNVRELIGQSGAHNILFPLITIFPQITVLLLIVATVLLLIVAMIISHTGTHNVFFPKVAMLLLGVTTKYNNLAEMYLILTCFLVTLVCLLLVFKDSVRSRVSLLGPILFVPVPFLVFSLRQHENMLWGFQITFAFAQVFSVLAFFLLHVSGRTRFKKAGFVAALGSGTVASFSALPGIFVWSGGLLQLLVAPAEKSGKWLRIGAWGLIGVGEWLVFFSGFLLFRSFHPDPIGPPLLYALDHPVAGMEFFLTLLGHSLFGQQGLAFASGILLAGIIAVVPLLIYRDRKPGGYSFWLALLLFSFLVLASTVAGRSGAGIEAAQASRYVSFSVLAVIGAYAVLVKLVLDRKSYTVASLLGILSVLIVLSVPGSYAEGVEVGRGTGASEETVPYRETAAYRERAAFILATYDSQPDEFLKALYPDPEFVRNVAPALEEFGYNVFSEPRPRVLPPPLSALSPVSSTTPSTVGSISGVGVDQDNQPVVISADKPSIEVSGWAVDAEAEDVAGGIYVDIDGELFPAFYGTDREDVASFFGVPSYRYSGFERAVPVSEIGTGTHKLSVIVLTNDKEGYYRPTQEVAFEIQTSDGP